MSEKFFKQKFFFVNNKSYFVNCYDKELLNKFCLLFNILAFIEIKKIIVTYLDKKLLSRISINNV
jgi:hypothetical protein